MAISPSKQKDEKDKDKLSHPTEEELACIGASLLLRFLPLSEPKKSEYIIKEFNDKP